MEDHGSSAAPIPTEPEAGSVLVPREPTEAMLEAACDVGPDTNSGGFSYDDARLVWSAMVSAALGQSPGEPE